jgi:hypothetical protein
MCVIGRIDELISKGGGRSHCLPRSRPCGSELPSLFLEEGEEEEIRSPSPCCARAHTTTTLARSLALSLSLSDFSFSFF